MVTAIMMINTERTKINDVAQQLAEIDGISEVYSVSGSFDIIAMVRVQTNDELADLVTTKLTGLKYITRTETALAFRTISKHDLEAMFSIGFK